LIQIDEDEGLHTIDNGLLITVDRDHG
jgi:hypothetical protein